MANPLARTRQNSMSRQQKLGIDIRTGLRVSPGLFQEIRNEQVSMLKRIGGFVKRRMRARIKKRKKPGRKGSYPSGHTGRLKYGIHWGFDASKMEVTIGGTRTNRPGSTLRPLHFGGVITAKVRKHRHLAEKVRRRFYIAARPAPTLAWRESEEWVLEQFSTMFRRINVRSPRGALRTSSASQVKERLAINAAYKQLRSSYLTAKKAHKASGAAGHFPTFKRLHGPFKLR